MSMATGLRLRRPPPPRRGRARTPGGGAHRCRGRGGCASAATPGKGGRALAPPHFLTGEDPPRHHAEPEIRGLVSCEPAAHVGRSIRFVAQLATEDADSI